jgi:hypothetical protein
VSLVPIANPVYAKKARIEHPSLIKALPLTVGEIAVLSKAHANTVSNKMAGNAGLYLQVHHVFTGASVASDNAFKREEFVFFLDEVSNQFVPDPALADCRVFPKLGSILRELEETDKSLANAVDVPLHIVRNIINGYPVAKNVVNAVFAELRRKKGDLKEGDCTFL